jgi:hypothetical protein
MRFGDIVLVEGVDCDAAEAAIAKQAVTAKVGDRTEAEAIRGVTEFGAADRHVCHIRDVRLGQIVVVENVDVDAADILTQQAIGQAAGIEPIGEAAEFTAADIGVDEIRRVDVEDFSIVQRRDFDAGAGGTASTIRAIAVAGSAGRVTDQVRDSAVADRGIKRLGYMRIDEAVGVDGVYVRTIQGVANNGTGYVGTHVDETFSVSVSIAGNDI